MASAINQIKVNDINYAIAASAYAECSTAAATAAKTASIITGGDESSADFTLIKGVSVKVKFTYSNTASNPTLNLNQTGAKSIKQYGITDAGTNVATSWRGGAIVDFVYDGTNWVMTNTTYSVGRGLKLDDTVISVNLGYTTNGKNYKVQADENSGLYVNVP